MDIKDFGPPRDPRLRRKLVGIACLALVVLIADPSDDAYGKESVDEPVQAMDWKGFYCQEDQAAVVAPAPADWPYPLYWVCVTLDDFADQDSLERLDGIVGH
jgi:hypothetical protein